MAEVKVLIEGYAKQLETGWNASSTTTLIKSDGKIIIVDPGCNRENLLNALKKENIKTDDVDFVVLTHAHGDHAILAGLFEKAKVITGEALIYDKDEQVEFGDTIEGTEVKIIETP